MAEMANTTLPQATDKRINFHCKTCIFLYSWSTHRKNDLPHKNCFILISLYQYYNYGRNGKKEDKKECGMEMCSGRKVSDYMRQWN